MKTRVRRSRILLDSYSREHQHAVHRTFEKLKLPLMTVAEALVTALKARHKVLAFGNGGSATQASHFVGELIGRFSKAPRRPLPAIALSSDPGILTCIGNDFGYGALFERQIEALAKPGDIAFGFTSSGTSENVVRGLAKAKQKRAVTTALTGAAGLTGARADYLLDVPSTSTSCIQEVHLILVHLLCVCVDEAFLSNRSKGGHSAGRDWLDG